jgi:AhpC/TSA antioxidant enzyme
MYTEATQCPFPIYADPSRKLYDQLGMSRTLSLGNKKPDYMRSSILAGVFKSMIQGVRSGSGVTKGGDIKQVGGEFMFEEGKVVWCHRMKNTRDHSEIPELRQVLGLGPRSDEGIPGSTSKENAGKAVDRGSGDLVDSVEKSTDPANGSVIPHEKADAQAMQGTTNGATAMNTT